VKRAKPILVIERSSRTAREPLLGRHIVRGTPDGVPITPKLQDLWRSSEDSDSVYHRLKKAVRDRDRLFPKDLEIKVLINEYKLSPEGHLLFRDRRWVPDSEELCTKLIQVIHDLIMYGHLGRDGTSALLTRQFFWPNMSK
jgi:hypothetical protein